MREELLRIIWLNVPAMADPQPEATLAQLGADSLSVIVIEMDIGRHVGFPLPENCFSECVTVGDILDVTEHLVRERACV